MKKRLFLFTTVVLVLLSVFSVICGAAYLGYGQNVLANEVKLIKTGLYGEVMKFTDSDFKSALATAEFDKIIITEIPSSSDGSLLLNERRVYVGQSIKRRNLNSLTFTPASKDITASGFTFKLNGESSPEYKCEIKFTDKINYAPKINTDASETLNVTTQKGVLVYGKIDAKDPEGDNLEYIFVTYPKYGTVKLTEENNGEFVYTPNSDFDGKDSFVYVVRDEYGNYTKPGTVSIKVIDRMSDVVYLDMEGKREYNAAIAMTAMGIMSGDRLGDDIYFLPDNTVTRAEFVAMAMKSLGMQADTSLTSTFFDDNDEIPKSLLSYVATAAKRGIINGSFDNDGLYFRPNDAITKCEAAIIMSNLTQLRTESEVFSEIDGIYDVPVFARAMVGAMFKEGIFTDNDASTLMSEATRSEVAEYLYKLAKI